jgi:hypothetical protein
LLVLHGRVTFHGKSGSKRVMWFARPGWSYG